MATRVDPTDSRQNESYSLAWFASVIHDFRFIIQRGARSFETYLVQTPKSDDGFGEEEALEA
jgi:hypothetical protein